MQTFLPYPDFARSAECLDNQRLGSQRKEAKQILEINICGPYQCVRITDPVWRWESCPARAYYADPATFAYRKTPWYNHPAVKMWRHWQISLASYGEICCQEWRRRGFTDNLLYFFKIHSAIRVDLQPAPDWVTPALCASHRSNLLRKNPAHYSQFGWTEPHDLPYVWPSKV